MLPNVEDPKPEPGDEGEYVDYQGDGQHKVYMAPWQKKVRNFGSRSTKVLAGRGTGKSAFLAFHMAETGIVGYLPECGGQCTRVAAKFRTSCVGHKLTFAGDGEAGEQSEEVGEGRAGQSDEHDDHDRQTVALLAVSVAGTSKPQLVVDQTNYQRHHWHLDATRECSMAALP